ncbi:MAG: hypothetical protein IAE80_18855 [Anaerolinea sp.]|nr:hypothetical protein [Anaerolinea sp.]
MPVNDLGLCSNCYAKLERDLIRMREWEDSEVAFGVPAERLEALREQVIREYGAAFELLEQPHEYKPKNKRSESRATQRKRKIAAQAIREYSTEDVLQAAQAFIQAQPEAWVNFSRVSQHLYEQFYRLKPKHLGAPAAKYSSLLKFIADYPDRFQLRSEPERRGVYWIRLADG